MTLLPWRFLTGLLALAVLGMSTPARAVPVYYTFSGVIRTATHCSATSGCGPYVTIDGKGAGSIVSYTFLVDFAQQGRRTSGYPGPPMDVSTYPDDIQATYAYDSIFATYVSGDILSPRTALDGDYLNGVFERGYDYSNDSGGRQAWLWDEHAAFSTGLTRTDWLNVTGSCAGCSSMWEIGRTFSGSNLRYQRMGSDYDDIESVLTLTNISAAAPVPEPSTLLLLGAGLLAIGRRFRSRRTSEPY